MDVLGICVGFVECQDIIFVGGYQYILNVDVVEYFVVEVLLLIYQKLFEVWLYVVGSNVFVSIEVLVSECVIIIGFVDDLQLLQDCMCVNVVFLCYGVGIKGKIGSVMVVGLFSVVIIIVIEGMGLVVGCDVLVVDDVQVLVDQVCQFYIDEVLWIVMSVVGISFVDQVWGVCVVWKVFEKIFDSVDLLVCQSKWLLLLWCLILN